MASLKYKRGDTIRLNVKVPNWGVTDYTGAQLFITGKTNKTDTDDQAPLKADETITTETTEFVLPASETADYPVGALYCDTQIVYANGEVETFGSFKIIIQQDITVRIA